MVIKKTVKAPAPKKPTLKKSAAVAKTKRIPQGKLKVLESTFIPEKRALQLKIEPIDGYTPSEKDPYMGAKMLNYFKTLLETLHTQTLAEISSARTATLEKEEDIVDDESGASGDATKEQSLSLMGFETTLLKEIEEALRRIDNKTYGYCEETEEPIGLKRMLAYPTARKSIEAQESMEFRES